MKGRSERGEHLRVEETASTAWKVCHQRERTKARVAGLGGGREGGSVSRARGAQRGE